MKRKLIWLIFLLFGLILALIVSGGEIKYFMNAVKEVKELIKKRSRYIEKIQKNAWRTSL